MTIAPKKEFFLQSWQIAPIAMGQGGCLATDRIVVDGVRVSYMYRESPSNDLDSGWRFFAGDEDDVYMSDNSKHGVYDVNTIVNYDPEILPFLISPIGSAYERDFSGKFILIRS